MVIDWNESYATGAYRQHWDYSHPSQELATALASGLVPAGGVVLDIGCGAGRDAIFAAQCGFQAFGVDLSSQAIAIAQEQAQKAGVSVVWQVGSATQLPIHDTTIDLASDRGCLHHIAVAERPLYFTEIARVLKSNGRLLLRGAASDEDNFFKPIQPATIDPFLRTNQLQRGPFVPITMLADENKELAAHIVWITKISD